MTIKQTQFQSDQEKGFLRLNKALALAGLCSRRRADDLIASGKVTINGKVVTELGTRVRVGVDQIVVSGKPIDIPLKKEKQHQYIVIYKPTHCVTTLMDPQGRKTILDLLPDELKKSRLFPVGRLDYMSEGLLFLTTDGELAYRLTHPRWHVEKEYLILVRGSVSNNILKTMMSGIVFDDGTKMIAKAASITFRHQDKTGLSLVLIQGLNRQIRKMCDAMGLTILQLSRVRQGPIRIGQLAKGEWRHLTEKEICDLKAAVSLTKD